MANHVGSYLPVNSIMASSPSLVADAKAKIFTLPPELIEQTLILAALYGFPSAIAHLSCTCRYFHQLVYCSTDNHLWREVFLTTFDDPRLVLGRIKSATTFSPGNVSKKGNGGCSRTGEAGFDWEHEFMRRMDAMRVMKKYKNQREEWYDTEMDSSHVEVCIFSTHVDGTYVSLESISLRSPQVSSISAGDRTPVSCPKKSGRGRTGTYLSLNNYRPRIILLTK
jgi:hypothetical protein